MASVSRERRLIDTFVSLADTLVDDYDVVDLLQGLVDTCTEVLDASAAGLLLADPHGQLAVVASTSENPELVDLLQYEEGPNPYFVAYEEGASISVPDLAADDRWTAYAGTAAGLELASVHVVPLKLRSVVIGTLGLFSSEPGPLSVDDAAVVKGLADVATIGILHERAIRESGIAQEQLQHALNSRVIIEQAKGVIAQLHRIDMDDAFTILRSYSRNHGTPLRDVAEQVVSRRITL